MAATDLKIYAHELGETLVDQGAQTIYNMYGIDIQDSGDTLPDGTAAADPIVYNDGVVVAPANYSIAAPTGVLTFGAPQGASDVITADYDWLLDDDSIEDTTVFNFTEEINRQKNTDANGRIQIVTARVVNQPFFGEITFPYLTETQFEYIRHLAITRNLTFDILRTSLSADFPYRAIMGLVALTNPAYEPIPGVPGRQTTSFQIQQLET